MTIQHLFPLAKPTLDLNFAAERSLDPRITFSRSSIGTYIDEDGILRTAAEDEPRFDYDPETGESLGLLIEEFRTNELENSDLNGLTEYGCRTEDSTEVNPEGVASCRRIILDAGFSGEGHRITQRYADFFDETACSVFVKMDTHPYVLIGAGGQQRGYTAAFNIDPAFTGDRLLGQGGLSTHTNIDAGYESYPNGWFRIWASGTTSGQDGWSLSISPDENTFNITNWDAAGTEAIFAHGGQYEYAGFVTSYIPTNGAAADRDADLGVASVSLTATTFSHVVKWDGPFLKGKRSIVYLDVNKKATKAALKVCEADIAPNRKIEAWMDTRYNSGANGGFPTVRMNFSDYKYAYHIASSFDSTTGIFTLTDGDQTLNNSGKPESNGIPFTRVVFGQDGFTGHIARYAFYSQALNNDQLEALTS